MRRHAGWIALLLLAGGCREREACLRCGTLVVAATGEPASLVPPLVQESVGRDVTDQVFERLAILTKDGSPVDSSAFLPGLASRWQRVDSLTWRFELRPGAAWHDGRPVTAGDVRFSFEAYADTALGAPAGRELAGVVVAEDGDRAVLVRFPRAHPEQLYDATYFVRIIPKHVFGPIPRAAWGADSGLARLVGSGPFRVVGWRRGQSLDLERVVKGTDNVNRIVWRFAGDQDAALNLVLAGEADVLETLTSPAGLERARADSTVSLIPYPAAVTGFLGFRLADAAGRPHPILADRTVRRALTAAIDRPTLVRAVLGDAVVPPGPISRALWIWNDNVRTQPFDPALAARMLDSAGWRPAGGGVRARSGRRLAIEILVPSTSVVRRELAAAIQQQWRSVGIGSTIAAVDFPIFQERLGQGRYDAMIGAYLDEPSPRGLANQWTRSGFGILNHGRYHNPSFDSLLTLASEMSDRHRARDLWREALDTLNADPAAVFLYTPTNVAVASKRVQTIEIDPFSWLSRVNGWRVAEPAD